MFQTHTIQDKFVGIISDEEEVTIPGQSITVKDIIFKAVNGLPIECSHYEDSEISQFEEYFDLQDELNANREKISDKDDGGEPAKPSKDEDEVKKD